MSTLSPLSSILSSVNTDPLTSKNLGLLLVVSIMKVCPCMITEISGSKAMEKLRDAICGKSGKNLDDLTHMTGKHFQHSYYFIVPIGIYISVIETKQ